MSAISGVARSTPSSDAQDAPANAGHPFFGPAVQSLQRWLPQPPSDLQSLWHSRARLSNKRGGLLIDPGAHKNLCGERWLERVTEHLQRAYPQVEHVDLAKAEDQEVRHRIRCFPLPEPLAVQGVGAGAPVATHKARVPIALETGDTASYTAPILAGSDIPALLGLESMEEKRTVLDLVHRRMYLMGPGDFTIQAPPGSHCLQLYKAESGHLMLPVTEFKNVTNQSRIEKGSNKPVPREFAFHYVPPTDVAPDQTGIVPSTTP